MGPFLRVGLELPALPSPVVGGDESIAPGDWLRAATAAGAAGSPAVWLTGGPGAAGVPTCDPCTLAGALVEALPSAMLGVVAVVGTGRNPSVVARDLTALDVVSGGRAAVLFRLPDLPASSGASPDLLVEAVAVCRAVLTEPHPLFEGRYFHVAGAVNRPPPVRPGGPLVLAEIGGRGGGAGPEVALAALDGVADAVVVGGPADHMAACRAALERLGSARRPWRGIGPRTSGGTEGPRGSDGTVPLVWRGPAPHLGHAPDEVAQGAAALLAAGADGIIVRVVPDAGAHAHGHGASLVAAVGDLAAALAPLAGGLVR